MLCRQLEAAEELARLAARTELASCAVDAEQAAGVTTHVSGKSMDTLREVAAECAAQVTLCPTAACTAELCMQQRKACISGRHACAADYAAQLMMNFIGLVLLLA